MLTIRDYQEWDEEAWLVCHALVDLKSEAWTMVTRRKPRYKGPKIELVAVLDGEIVGFIDVEIETRPGELCLAGEASAAQTLELGVLPSHWGTGIGRELLRETITRLRLRGIHRLEFWTRDQRTKGFITHSGARPLRDYYQVRLDPAGSELENELRANAVNPLVIVANVSQGAMAGVRTTYQVTEAALCSGYEFRI